MIELDWASSMALVHPEHRTAVVAALAHVEETGQGEMEYLQGTKSGDYRWISTRMFLARDGAGKPLYRYGSARDVTEFRNAETALREKESQYRALFENNLDAIFMSVPDGTILSANPAACAMFGMTEEELCRSGRGPRVADENLNLAIGERGRTGSFKGELLLVRKDGTPFIGEVSSVLLPGDKQRSFVIVHDATDRKRAETERARLVLSIEQVNESVVITDVDGFIVYVNPGFEKLSGYKRAEVMGSNPRILKSGRHPASTYQQMWAILLRGEVWSGNLVNKRRDGTLYNEEATISPIKDQDGKIISFVGVGRDVTDELLLRDQLNQAQKMETVGRLAGGIAHDFNNLMMVIRTYTELMQAEFSAEHRAQRYAEQVIKALERGTSLTSQMLAFSRRRVASTVALDLNGVLAEAARMLKQVIGEDIDFRVTPADSVWAIEADPDLIFQVLMNFCVNARDAMPQGGTLTLATENTSVNHAGIDGHPYVLPGEYVKLTVTDNGTGMSKDTQARIFEPFFTTKEVGKGTGLGLAMVYGVVKQSSGYVWVDSEVGQGTCFTLYLPRISRAATPPAPAKHDALPTGTETILIVEDEVLLSKGISEFLISLGYKVLAANSGSEALALAAEHEHIDLLLTDLVMPQMSGTELAHVLGSLRPALKAIFMSGYVEHELDHCGEQQPHFLQKPFGLNKLACRVRNALDGTEPPQ
jgi:PAS domain S-box-containing protein